MPSHRRSGRYPEDPMMSLDGNRRYAWAMFYNKDAEAAELRERLDILVPLCRELIRLEVWGRPFERFAKAYELEQILDRYEQRHNGNAA